MLDVLVSPFLDNGFLLDALLAGVLVASICAVAGTFVVLRGLAFVADALAHGVLPGIAVAVLAGWPGMVGAVIGSVVMMSGVRVVSRRGGLSNDTAIGILFAGMLALGVMITSRSRSFTGDLTRILFGELLGVDDSDLLGLAVALLVVAAMAWIFRRPFLLLCFDPEVAATSGFSVSRYEVMLLAMVAVAVVASFQVAGTLLVFGMLVAPAATGALVSRRIATMTLTAALVGSGSTYAGLLISYHFDLAASASVVGVAVAVFFAVLAVTTVASGRAASGRAASGRAVSGQPAHHGGHHHG